jgi:hypothetical protein
VALAAAEDDEEVVMLETVVDDEELEVEESEDVLCDVLVLVEEEEEEVVLGGGVEVEVGVWVVDGGVYCEVDELVVVVESLANDHVPVTSPMVLGSPIRLLKRL